MRALDVETSPVTGDLSNGYALEPWRVRQGKAFISSIAIYGDDGYKVNVQRPSKGQLISLLEEQAGHEVYAQNTPFDIGWLVASISQDKVKPVPEVVRKIRWRDTKLLAKWICNGQQAEDMYFSYSLVNLVQSFLSDAPGTAEFVQMKNNVTLDPSSPYWLDRGLMDAIKTLELAKLLESKLKPEQKRGYLIEQRNLAFVANSWLVGVRVNQDKLIQAEEKYIIERDTMIKEADLGLSVEALTSPKQLSAIIYGKLGMPVISKTKTGQPSTDADTLKLLAFQTNDARLKKLVRAKECATMLSKYVKTAKAALERTGDGYMYGVPNIFGTNTGRFTMSNETLKEQKVSIAMHQIPRKEKLVREYMEPPEGYRVMEADAMAQESRIMAIWSRDENMINIFRNKIDPHAWMGEQIYGVPWETIFKGAKSGIFELNEKRQNGKLLNLASNFRIGGESFARKSFTEYDKWMSVEDGYQMQRIFKRAYPGVPRYWDSIINFASVNGYTYTLAQRRYKVHKWDGRDRWGTEGTVISMPIQGTAAEHLHGAMTACHDHVMITTLHDATFFAVSGDEEAKEIDAKMNSVDFQALWNVELPIDLPFEHKVGGSFAEVK